MMNPFGWGQGLIILVIKYQYVCDRHNNRHTDHVIYVDCTNGVERRRISNDFSLYKKFTLSLNQKVMKKKDTEMGLKQ